MKTLAIIMILGLSLLTGACRKAPVRPPAVPPPAPPVSAAPPPIPVPEVWPELPLPPSRLPAPPEPPIPKNFRDGEASFMSGNYPGAIRGYEKFIREDPITQFKDVAMFRLAMSQALVCQVPECRARSMDEFKRLVAKYPKSPYSAEARLILNMQAEIERVKSDVKSRDDRIKKLTDELERLKKIDLERRPPRIKK
jgi:hypothetical protein